MVNFAWFGRIINGLGLGALASALAGIENLPSYIWFLYTTIWLGSLFLVIASPTRR